MSDRKSSADLGPNVEALLSGFPFAERDWHEDVLAVEARLASVERGSSSPALLEAPLPAEPGEPITAASATATPLVNSGVRTQSLAELARRSVENKQASEREVARATLALAAQPRARAEEVQALREAMNRRMPAAVSTASSGEAATANADSSTTPNAALSPESSALARPNAPPSLGKRAVVWPRVAVASGLVALAAVWLIWIRQSADPEPLITAVVSPPSDVATTNGAINPASTAPALQGVPSGVDPSTLPEVASSAVLPASDKLAKSERGAAATRSTAEAASSAPSAEKIVLEDDGASAAPVAVAAAEQPVAKTLPPDPALRPADSTGGALPAKPSTGAVQAALGAVMSGARHCVAGDDGPSSAVVVFASDGHVQSVAVSGPAAGKSAGSCIEAQLGRARVQPFAASNFSVSATVRPD
jgi:hypothetical protein